MAEATQVESPPTAKGGKLGIVIWIAITLVAAAGGFALPFLLPAGWLKSAPPTETAAQTFSLPGTAKPAFLTFGEVVVNLDEGRLNRYLRLSITLQVHQQDQEELTKLLEAKKAILRNWLLSYLSDQDMDAIRGAAGQNKLRREIQAHFNTVLFPDGFDRIHDVLFEEFNIQ